jgi:hypothetical protein
MARTFAALDAVLDDAIELPAGPNGEVYRIEGPPAEDGLRIERIMSLATRLAAGGEVKNTEVLDDDQELDLYRAALGGTYDQLLADLSWPRFKHVAMTVVFWITADLDTAERYWASGGDPNRAAPNRATRRAGTRSSGTAAATSTPRRGSTSGTSTRKATSRAAKA